MQVEVVFENITERILEEIRMANTSIFVAVAWFTDGEIFNELVKKSKTCTVSLIISNHEINENSSIDYDRLVTEKSDVYRIGNGDLQLMHHKFCVIDNKTVINGSFNWSNKAKYNYENVIIIKDNISLAQQFINEFNKLLDLDYEYTKKSENIDRIIKHLHTIQKYIHTNDVKGIVKEFVDMIKCELDADILEILENIKNEEFILANTKIDNYLSKNQLTHHSFNDDRLYGLELEYAVVDRSELKVHEYTKNDGTPFQKYSYDGFQGAWAVLNGKQFSIYGKMDEVSIGVLVAVRDDAKRGIKAGTKILGGYAR